MDTSSLIAIANTTHWDLFASSVHITTTNVCWHELKHHAESYTYPPEGSRENYLKTGSERVLEYLSADETTFSCVTIVPRPHGPDAGEQSLQQEIAEYPDVYQVVSILDKPARRSLRRHIRENGYDIDVVGPPYLLYILLDTDLLSQEESCETTAQIIRTEGWTGYETVKSAWENIPVDCSSVLDDEYSDVLPPR